MGTQSNQPQSGPTTSRPLDLKNREDFWNQSGDFGIAETPFPSFSWLVRNKKEIEIISEPQQYYYVKLF